jgi:hypothetical protein
MRLESPLWWSCVLKVPAKSCRRRCAVDCSYDCAVRNRTPDQTKSTRANVELRGIIGSPQRPLVHNTLWTGLRTGKLPYNRLVQISCKVSFSLSSPEPSHSVNSEESNQSTHAPRVENRQDYEYGEKEEDLEIDLTGRAYLWHERRQKILPDL